MSQESKQHWVLAFDIERSGALDIHHTIGIGASVVDENLVELDSLFLPGHVEGKTVFEKRCYDEFWSKHLDKLKILEYTGPLSFEERQIEMTQQFQAFRAKWENEATKSGVKFELVADNNVYDGGFINQLIFKHTNNLPIPYNTCGEYNAFWETHSEQRGFLFAVDPDFNKNWGFTNRIAELYDVPPMLREHDHNPANDAYSIAFDQQVLHQIRAGRIKRRA